ncbi:hypothetical protein F6J84_11040 [Microbacterium caowuchunii]|uniref:hypothetical protein n=1 Tax=Microbacterium caowuchunii TaxID=2614638 RepID=UPI001243EE8A|nr:hypothetical protein [Microbacterium caowuchunii]QEW00575.1 hypothetical protein F6J84_11040 [Microbacterium caowuchunii]
MRWDRFFEDLQDQFDAEWEAERAILDTEGERLRLAKVGLRERLVELGRGDPAARAEVWFELRDDSTVTGHVSAVGADWVGVESAGRTGIIPVGSIAAIGLDHADMLRSARPGPDGRPSLTERMTLGFVLRDLVRRRVPVTVLTAHGRALTGTIDRAGADHLDLALHDPGSPRRAEAVRGHRLVPFAAVGWVRVDAVERL